MKMVSVAILIATLVASVSGAKLASWYDDALAARYDKISAPASCIAQYDEIYLQFLSPRLDEKGGGDSYVDNYPNQFIGKYYCLNICNEKCPTITIGYRRVEIIPQLKQDTPSDAKLDCKCDPNKGSKCKIMGTPFDEVQAYYETNCLGWVDGQSVAATTPVADTAAPPAIEDPVDEKFKCKSTQRPVFLVSQHHTYNTIAAQLIDLDDKSEHECLDMCRERDPETSSTPCYTAMYERTTRRCHLYGSNVKNKVNSAGEAITGLLIGNQYVMYERHCVRTEVAEAAVCNDGIIHKLPGYAHVVDEDHSLMVMDYVLQTTTTMGECLDMCYNFPTDACPCSFVTWDLNSEECALYPAGRLMTVKDVRNTTLLAGGKFDSAMLPTCTLVHKGYDYANYNGY